MSDAPISPEGPPVIPDTTVNVEAPVIPEPSDTTVVIEDVAPNDPTDALDFSERVNRIVDERVNQRISSLEERITSLVTPAPAPEVVVVTPEPAPAPTPTPEPVATPDEPPKAEPTPDEAPPNDHWYFKKRGKRGG